MTFQSTRSCQSIRAFNLGAALSILTLGVVATPAAFAGEAFVNNTHRNTYGYSETDLNIDSESYTEGSRQFVSVAAKVFIDGKLGLDSPVELEPPVLVPPVAEIPAPLSALEEAPAAPFGTNVAFDKFTVHAAFSKELGEEEFESETYVDGTIFAYEEFDETSHTTSAGIR